jgi:hypothetical protein
VDWPTCSHDGCIGIRLADNAAYLAHASDRDRKAALKQRGDTGAIDARGVPIAEALLEQILSAAPHDADNHPTFTAAGFDGASFQGDAGFYEASFQGDAGFVGVIVRRDARFVEARFEQARQLGPLLVYGLLRLDGAHFGNSP